MRQRLLLQMVMAVLLAGVAAAQSGTALSGPTMGLVFDSSQSALRPIRGIPGAASLGDAVNPGFALASATVSPRQDYALALRADDSSVVLVRAGGASAAITGARPAPALMVFSPAGTAAALYNSGAGRVQILTGLPDAAAVQNDVDISALAGPVAALAVDNAGTSLFLAAGAAEAVSLYRVATDGTSQYSWLRSAVLPRCACRTTAARPCWRIPPPARCTSSASCGAPATWRRLRPGAMAWAHPSPSNPIPRDASSWQIKRAR